MLGGFVRTASAPWSAGVSLQSKTADVVLKMTDGASTESKWRGTGHARRKPTWAWMGRGGGGFLGGFAAAGASSYANTEIGQVVTMAYLELISKMAVE